VTPLEHSSSAQPAQRGSRQKKSAQVVPSVGLAAQKIVWHPISASKLGLSRRCCTCRDKAAMWNSDRKATHANDLSFALSLSCAQSFSLPTESLCHCSPFRRRLSDESPSDHTGRPSMTHMMVSTVIRRHHCLRGCNLSSILFVGDNYFTNVARRLADHVP
jgi:hypothetical protein